MTPAARIATTIELLDAVFQSPRPAESTVTAFLRRRRYIGAKDRTAVADRVYACLRRRARLGWWLDSIGHGDRGGRALLLADLALTEDSPVERLGRWFSGDRYAPAVLSEAEVRLVEALAGRGIDDPEMPAAIAAECPDWAAGSLQAAFGGRFAVELSALLSPAPVDLRVNGLKLDRAAALSALAASGVAAEPTPLSPVGVRVQGRPPLASHHLFKTGAIEIQDEGSQLLALLVDARPGHQVVDFCAGAGGKSLALAARMAGKGRVVACEVSEPRLTRARERLRRAAVDNVEPRLLGSERDPWVKRQKGKFDRVLVDVPCSGSGTWRRHPDARWRPVDMADHVAVQARILDSAARLVKPGGRLVYATCSLLPEENDRQVAGFLDRTPGFRPLPIADAWAAGVGTPPVAHGEALLLTPAQHGTDGFFVSVLEREAA